MFFEGDSLDEGGRSSCKLGLDPLVVTLRHSLELLMLPLETKHHTSTLQNKKNVSFSWPIRLAML